MEILKSVILGIVQGATEFIPISSSGHLILFRDLLNLNTEYGLSEDAVFQLATTFAILVYFRKNIFSLIKTFFNILFMKTVESVEKINLINIVLASIPAIFLGILLEKYMESIFRNSTLVACALIIGAVIMFLSETYLKHTQVKKTNLKIIGDGADTEMEKIPTMTHKRAFFIGLFQSLALIPGMSRSGMSISGGLFNGLNREESTRFAFLIAFPILFGSGFKKLFELYNTGALNMIGLDVLVGSVTAFIVGIFAIHLLIKFLKNKTLNVFIIYRVILAIIILVLF